MDLKRLKYFLIWIQGGRWSAGLGTQKLVGATQWWNKLVSWGGSVKMFFGGGSITENPEKQLSWALFQFICLNLFQANQSIKAKKYQTILHCFASVKKDKSSTIYMCF